jgi:hypothetical protein
MERLIYSEEDLNIINKHASLVDDANKFDALYNSSCSASEHLLGHANTFGYNVGAYKTMQIHQSKIKFASDGEISRLHQLGNQEFEYRFRNSIHPIYDIISTFNYNPTSHTWADIELFEHTQQIKPIFVCKEIIPANIDLMNCSLKHHGTTTNPNEDVKLVEVRMNFENIIIIIDKLKDLELAKQIIIKIPYFQKHLPEIRRLTKYEIKNKRFAFEGAVNTLVSRLNKGDQAFTCRLEDEKFLLQRFTDFEDKNNISRRVEGAIIKLDRILNTI